MNTDSSVHATTRQKLRFWHSRRAQALGLLPLLLLLTLRTEGQTQFDYTINNGTITITGYNGPSGEVTIPGTISGLPVTSIGDYAFLSDNRPTSVTFPDSLINIGDLAFSSCMRLTSVRIPSVTKIGWNAFSDCSSLTDLTCPDNLISIGDWAFSSCTKLTNVTFSTSITRIGDYAFASCTSLANITIPSSITSVSDGAFSSCTSLASVTIPTSVTNIGGSAFSSCTSLTNVAIPTSVTSLGDSAFAACTALRDVAIPGSVTRIGSAAFSACTGLRNVTIPLGVTSLGVSAFSSCSNLTSMTMGPNVDILGDSAFQYCAELTGVYFEGNAPSVVGKSVFDGDNETIVYYLAGTTGWGETFGGRPTMLWIPQGQLTVTNVGVWTNLFGFTITGPSGWDVVVEASTSLSNPAWVPLETNTLNSGSAYFSDPKWTNYPARFYRLHSP